MRPILIIAAMVAFAATCLAGGPTDGPKTVSDFLSLLPLQEDDGWGDDWGSPPVENPEEEPLMPGEEPPLPTEPGFPAAPTKVKGMRLEAFFGGVLPLMSKETTYTGGLAVGIGFRFPLGGKIPEWIRGAIDFGFIGADEEEWEGSSTLILAHVDLGADLLKMDAVRGGAFLSVGVASELFNAEDTIGAGTDTSETNINGLAGIGGFFGFAPSPQFHLDLVARMTFPLGSRNVQGMVLVGVEAAYVF
ncbi:MAG: hypothetical protein ACYS47_19950 [Planctomycetota bacterium]|jgi:hypothetical protein